MGKGPEMLLFAVAILLSFVFIIIFVSLAICKGISVISFPVVISDYLSPF